MRTTTILASLLPLLLGSCSIAITRPVAPLAEFGLATPQDKPREIDDQKIAEAFAKKEQIQWPARLAVARLGETRHSHGQHAAALTNVPSSEQQVLDAAFPRGPQWSQVFPLAPLFTGSGTASLRDLRFEAAKAHADLLLVYGVSASEGSAWNPLGILNFAILPAFVLPGSDYETCCVGGMALVDVRNGQVYALANHDERSTCSAPTASKKSAFEGLFQKGSAAVIERMIADVRRQLPRS